MIIREIRAAGLRGETPAGGWSHELTPTDVVHTLISVHTSEGLVGVGSVFTSEALVLASLELLKDQYTLYQYPKQRRINWVHSKSAAVALIQSPDTPYLIIIA